MTEPESKRFHFEQGEELLEELNNGEGVSPELSRTMSDELNQFRRHPDDAWHRRQGTAEPLGRR